MEEKPIEKEQDQLIPKKKVSKRKAYTPPTLTVYGKLTELTGGGPSGNKENQGPGGSLDTTRQVRT